MSKRMVKAIEHGEPKDQRTEDSENDEVEGADSINTKSGSSIQYLQDLTHPLFYGVAEIVSRFCHSKLDVIPYAFKCSLIGSVLTRMCIFIPFALVTFT